MKNIKEVGPKHLPVKLNKHPDDWTVKFFMKQFNTILDSDKMPEE